jgi:hypothetical protein
MSHSIRLTIEGHAFEGALYTGAAALEISRALPLEVELERWGGEYWGDVHVPIAIDGDDVRSEMKPGELAFWPATNSLCVFFGPTPTSRADEPRAVEPVDPIGRVHGDLSVLSELGSTVTALLERVEWRTELPASEKIS